MPFHRQNKTNKAIKQIKRSDMVTFLFFVFTITEANQYAGLGRAEPGLESSAETLRCRYNDVDVATRQSSCHHRLKQDFRREHYIFLLKM